MLAATLLGLLLLHFTLFKNPAAGYDPLVGNRAYPRQRQPASLTLGKDQTPPATLG